MSSYLAQGVNFLLTERKAHVRINPGKKGFLVEVVDRVTVEDYHTDRCLFSVTTWDVADAMLKVQNYLYSAKRADDEASKREQTQAQAQAEVAA